jgi:hypothetical protein
LNSESKANCGEGKHRKIQYKPLPEVLEFKLSEDEGDYRLLHIAMEEVIFVINSVELQRIPLGI